MIFITFHENRPVEVNNIKQLILENHLTSIITSFFTIHFNIIVQSKPGSSKLYLLPGFPAKALYVFSLSLVRATSITHLILLLYIFCD